MSFSILGSVYPLVSKHGWKSPYKYGGFSGKIINTKWWIIFNSQIPNVPRTNGFHSFPTKCNCRTVCVKYVVS